MCRIGPRCGSRTSQGALTLRSSRSCSSASREPGAKSTLDAYGRALAAEYEARIPSVYDREYVARIAPATGLPREALERAEARTESFSPNAFGTLTERVPVCLSHDRTNPVGWLGTRFVMVGWHHTTRCYARMPITWTGARTRWPDWLRKSSVTRTAYSN